MSLEVNPLSDVLGAEILGIDLQNEMNAGTVAEIMRIWRHYQVIVFRDQDLNEAQQLRFAEKFGEIWTMPSETFPFGLDEYIDDPKRVMLISNVRKDGIPIGQIPDGEMGLHSDNMYREVPAKATLLYGIDVPSKGGATRFANMYTAFEELPQYLKEVLDRRMATHGYTYGQFITESEQKTGNAGTCTFPAVITHPETQRRALYVAELMTIRLEDMKEEDSKTCLEEIYDHIDQPRFVYEHPWRKGDLVIWDNRCVQHGRTDFDPSERRLLRRITTKVDVPPAA